MITKGRDRALGQMIQGWLMDHNETQSGLARHLGVTRQRVWQWEVRGVPQYDARLVQLALAQLDQGKDRRSLNMKVRAALKELISALEDQES